MAAVGMVQVPFHQVVGVIAVGYGGVAAARTMLVAFIMAIAAMSRRANRRVRRADFKDMFFDLVAVLMMQVAVVQEIDVVAVLDAGVPAVRTVLVGVAFVSCHVNRLLLGK
jgi:hypothetical protein